MSEDLCDIGENDWAAIFGKKAEVVGGDADGVLEYREPPVNPPFREGDVLDTVGQGIDVALNPAGAGPPPYSVALCLGSQKNAIPERRCPYSVFRVSAPFT